MGVRVACAFYTLLSCVVGAAGSEQGAELAVRVVTANIFASLVHPGCHVQAVAVHSRLTLVLLGLEEVHTLRRVYLAHSLQLFKLDLAALVVVVILVHICPPDALAKVDLVALEVLPV
jgi:hypothetical protein